MKMLRREKGITLVALIITIIVLLILAVVAIRAVQGDGIISHAKNARAEYEKGQLKEETKLSEYEQYIASLGERTLEEITIENAQSVNMLERKQNTQTHDKYGNKIVVPAGFKILIDGTTDYKEDTIDVTKGIVITDAVDESGKSIGNEFVWIPVGDVYTTEEKEKTESNTTKIELKRYVFADGNTTYEEGKLERGTIVSSLTQTEPGAQLKDSLNSTYYTEGLKDSKTSNAHAKDIVAFKTSAINNHGYYIGRYEAGVSGYDETATNNNTQPSGETNWTKYTTADGKVPQLVCKSNQQVWNYVTQKKASELCQSMYINEPYESDLINSYAWNTAIVFIQTFGANGVGGKEPDSSTYSRKNKSTGSINTGMNPDKYRNIYDMSGNAEEWTTETSSYSNNPCTLHGGYYDTYMSYAILYTSDRGDWNTTNSSIYNSFRPLLYV